MKILLISVICIIKILCIIILWHNYKKDTMDVFPVHYEESLKNTKKEKIEYIVPRYYENIDWIYDYPDIKFTIYNKGYDIPIPPNIKLITLPNIGKDAHTILYHIIENYDNLADITIFGANNKHREEKVKKTIELTIQTENSVFICEDNQLRNYDFIIDHWRTRGDMKLSKLNPSSVRPYGKWKDLLWPNTDVTWICYMCIFSVHKNHIRQHSKEYYQYILNNLTTNDDEMVHYIERAFTIIFYPYPMSCVYNFIFD